MYYKRKLIILKWLQNVAFALWKRALFIHNEHFISNAINVFLIDINLTLIAKPAKTDFEQSLLPIFDWQKGKLYIQITKYLHDAGIMHTRVQWHVVTVTSS